MGRSGGLHSDTIEGKYFTEKVIFVFAGFAVFFRPFFYLCIAPHTHTLGNGMGDLKTGASAHFTRHIHTHLTPYPAHTMARRRRGGRFKKMLNCTHNTGGKVNKPTHNITMAQWLFFDLCFYCFKWPIFCGKIGICTRAVSFRFRG